MCESEEDTTFLRQTSRSGGGGGALRCSLTRETKINPRTEIGAETRKAFVSSGQAAGVVIREYVAVCVNCEARRRYDTLAAAIRSRGANWDSLH